MLRQAVSFGRSGLTRIVNSVAATATQLSQRIKSACPGERLSRFSLVLCSVFCFCFAIFALVEFTRKYPTPAPRPPAPDTTTTTAPPPPAPRPPHVFANYTCTGLAPYDYRCGLDGGTARGTVPTKAGARRLLAAGVFALTGPDPIPADTACVRNKLTVPGTSPAAEQVREPDQIHFYLSNHRTQRDSATTLDFSVNEVACLGLDFVIPGQENQDGDLMSVRAEVVRGGGVMDSTEILPIMQYRLYNDSSSSHSTLGGRRIR